jgi:hypothetical protein
VSRYSIRVNHGTTYDVTRAELVHLVSVGEHVALLDLGRSIWQAEDGQFWWQGGDGRPHGPFRSAGRVVRSALRG